MIVLDYKNKYHHRIIASCISALKTGKVIAYPTDTSYGLAVDATNVKAIKRLYKIKGRGFNKPSSVVVPSAAYAKKNTRWNKVVDRLAKKFWPGMITLVLPLTSAPLLRGRGIKGEGAKILTGKTGWIGLRMPKNKIALDLAKYLKKPITATSANLAGRPDCYPAKDIIAQFQNQKLKPDIIINTGKLSKRKPSTVVKIGGGRVEIIRQGPIAKQTIIKVLSAKR